MFTTGSLVKRAWVHMDIATFAILANPDSSDTETELWDKEKILRYFVSIMRNVKIMQYLVKFRNYEILGHNWEILRQNYEV